MCKDYHRWRYTMDAIWKNYRKNKIALREQENDIIYKHGVGDGMPHGSGVGNPTCERAVEMATNHEIVELRRKVRIVEDTLDIIPYLRKGEMKLRLVTAVYIDNRRTLAGEAAHLGIGERTAYRWKKEVWAIAAKKMNPPE